MQKKFFLVVAAALIAATCVYPVAYTFAACGALAVFMIATYFAGCALHTRLQLPATHRTPMMIFSFVGVVFTAVWYATIEFPMVFRVAIGFEIDGFFALGGALLGCLCGWFASLLKHYDLPFSAQKLGMAHTREK